MHFKFPSSFALSLLFSSILLSFLCCLLELPRGIEGKSEDRFQTTGQVQSRTFQTHGESSTTNSNSNVNTSPNRHLRFRECTSEDNCEANEDCVNGRCAKHCETSTDCHHWQTCESKVCLPNSNLCPDPGEYWDGKKCQPLTNSTTAVIALSVIAGILFFALILGLYFLAKNGYLPIPGFSRRSSKPIRRTKRLKTPEGSVKDGDSKKDSVKSGHHVGVQAPTTLATIDE